MPIDKGYKSIVQKRFLFFIKAAVLPEKLIFLASILHRLLADYQIILFSTTIIAVKNH
jgi:hypothetical protein